jgi:hypothetical protein
LAGLGETLGSPWPPLAIRPWLLLRSRQRKKINLPAPDLPLTQSLYRHLLLMISPNEISHKNQDVSVAGLGYFKHFLCDLNCNQANIGVLRFQGKLIFQTHSISNS